MPRSACSPLSSAAIADGPPATPPANNPVLTGQTQSEVFPGTQTFTGPKHAGSRAAGPSDVTLNFPNADVHEVAKAILGDILGLNYAVDPSATGSVTVETAEPVAKADVLPILEESLQAAHLGLIKKGAVYTIIPIDKAKKQPQAAQRERARLRQRGDHAALRERRRAQEASRSARAGRGRSAQADAGRNIVIITGTADQRNSIRGLVEQFDVNWLHGMSFALLVPERTDVHMLQPELDAIVNTPNSPTQGLVKLIVIDRLNGILAISPQPQYLKDLKKWMEVLDRAGGDNERKLFVYHVQNGRAADLATVLINAFGGGSASSGAAAHPTAPNLAATGQASQIGSTIVRFRARRRPDRAASAIPAADRRRLRRLGRRLRQQRQHQRLRPEHRRVDQSLARAGRHAVPAAERRRRRSSFPGGGQPISVSSDENNNAIVVYGDAAPIRHHRRTRCNSSTPCRCRS